jgi:hypothetical protein
MYVTESVEGDLLLKVVMIDVDVFGTCGETFTPSHVDGAFVVNAKGNSLWQDNTSDVTGGLLSSIRRLIGESEGTYHERRRAANQVRSRPA